MARQAVTGQPQR